MVVKIGAANEILTTVAKGKFLKAINIAIKAIKPDKHLKKCKPGLLVQQKFLILPLGIKKNKKVSQKSL